MLEHKLLLLADGYFPHVPKLKHQCCSYNYSLLCVEGVGAYLCDIFAQAVLDALRQIDPDVESIVVYSAFVVAYLLQQDPGWDNMSKAWVGLTDRTALRLHVC
jgi:hypothetical protein